VRLAVGAQDEREAAGPAAVLVEGGERHTRHHTGLGARGPGAWRERDAAGGPQQGEERQPRAVRSAHAPGRQTIMTMIETARKMPSSTQM
jgi:hypothetical protein